MFWNLWAFCHHLTLLTEWSVGRSFEKNAAAWNPTVARDQNRKWWESTPSLAAAAGEYIYSNHLCPLIVLYAWELFFCYHFKRNSAARKAVRKTEKTKKNCCQETYSDPKKCNSTWPALPHSTCWRCERGMCVWRRRQWRLPRWLDRAWVSRPRSLLHLPRPQRSPSGQSRSVGSECRRLEDSRVFTAAHLSSCSSLILGLFGGWDLWWSETRRCEWWAGMWKDQSAATSENIFSLILKQFGSYGKTQQVCWLSTFSAIPQGLE